MDRPGEDDLGALAAGLGDFTQDGVRLQLGCVVGIFSCYEVESEDALRVAAVERDTLDAEARVVKVAREPAGEMSIYQRWGFIWFTHC